VLPYIDPFAILPYAGEVIFSLPFLSNAHSDLSLYIAYPSFSLWKLMLWCVFLPKFTSELLMTIGACAIAIETFRSTQPNFGSSTDSRRIIFSFDGSNTLQEDQATVDSNYASAVLYPYLFSLTLGSWRRRVFGPNCRAKFLAWAHNGIFCSHIPPQSLLISMYNEVPIWRRDSTRHVS
jgi:hypothetical protein